MLALIIIVVAIYIVHMNIKKKKETISEEIRKKIMDSQALKDIMDFLTDLSNLTRECRCDLSFDCEEFKGALYGTVVSAPATIEGFKSFYEIIFRQHEHFQQELHTQFNAGKLDLKQVVKQVEDHEVQSYKELTSELLGKNAPNSKPFIDYLRGDIKPANDNDVVIKYGIVLDFLTDEDSKNPKRKREKVYTFLKILQENCREAFSNCSSYLTDTISLILKFTPIE